MDEEAVRALCGIFHVPRTMSSGNMNETSCGNPLKSNESSEKKLSNGQRARSLKIVFQDRPLSGIGIDRLVGVQDLEVLRFRDKQIDKTAFCANLGLQRDFFFYPVVLAYHHDEFEVPACSEPDIAFDNTFSPAIAAGTFIDRHGTLRTVGVRGQLS